MELTAPYLKSTAILCGDDFEGIDHEIDGLFQRIKQKFAGFNYYDKEEPDLRVIGYEDLADPAILDKMHFVWVIGIAGEKSFEETRKTISGLKLKGIPVHLALSLGFGDIKIKPLWDHEICVNCEDRDKSLSFIEALTCSMLFPSVIEPDLSDIIEIFGGKNCELEIIKGLDLAELTDEINIYASKLFNYQNLFVIMSLPLHFEETLSLVDEIGDIFYGSNNEAFEIFFVDTLSINGLKQCSLLAQ